MKCGFKFIERDEDKGLGLGRCDQKAFYFYKRDQAGRFVQDIKGWIATCMLHYLRQEEITVWGDENEVFASIVVED